MNKLETIIYQLNVLNKDYKRQQEQYEAQKTFYESQIIKAYDRKGVRTHDFSNNDLYYKATIVQQKKIKFKIDVLEQVLDKKTLSEICDKKYEIVDYVGMVEYLKSLGASPKEFKKFIHCEKTVNKNRLDQKSELGELSLDDLEGCYTVSESTPWIRITESEEELSE